MTAQDQQSRATVLPCPFCGHAPTTSNIHYAADASTYCAVFCDCGAQGPSGDVEHSHEHAAVKWNRRAPVEQAARSLPAGMEPVAYLHRMRDSDTGCVWFTRKPEAGADPVYTAAQVLAMGRVPINAEAAWDAFEEAVRVNVGVKELVNIMGSVKSLRTMFLKAASRPPAAQERKPLNSVREMLDQQKGKRDALQAKGMCADCEGEGVQGGQFCGGADWTCETCAGTGQFAQEAP